MQNSMDPASYEAWYHTPRGKWIGRQERTVLQRFLPSFNNFSLLDIGSGTGYFSRYFSIPGFAVTAIEPNRSMQIYARQLDDRINYIGARVEMLPCRDNSFDYVTAITSLCFVQQPAMALAEMWRVSRRGVVLGLLNRRSLLYWRKHERGGYRGARWDSRDEILNWTKDLRPLPGVSKWRTAIILPSGNPLARITERIFSHRLPWGGFLALYLEKPASPA